MTDEEFQEDVWPLLQGCYPRMCRTLTKHEIGSYYRVLSKFSVQVASDAIRKFKDTSKYNPKPSELGSLCWKAKDASRPSVSGPKNHGDPWSHQKEEWIKSAPSKADEINGLGDDEVLIRIKHFSWEKSKDMWGPRHPFTRGQWFEWQRRLYWTNGRTDPPSIEEFDAAFPEERIK